MKTFLVILTSIFAVMSLVLNWATLMGSPVTSNFGLFNVVITLELDAVSLAPAPVKLAQRTSSLVSKSG